MFEDLIAVAEKYTAKELYEFDENELQDLIQAKCTLEGHYPTDDHCGRPEHRYCYVCLTGLPNVEI